MKALEPLLIEFMPRINSKLNSGMTLIETMVALLILAFIITAITTIIVQINALTNSARLRGGAVAQVQSTLEQVRGYYQQNGWNALAAAAGTTGTPNCYGDGQNLTSANLISGCLPPAAINSTYSRIVRVFTTANDQTKVTVQAVIYWSDKGDKSLESDVNFYNY